MVSPSDRYLNLFALFDWQFANLVVSPRFVHSLLESLWSIGETLLHQRLCDDLRGFCLRAHTWQVDDNTILCHADTNTNDNKEETKVANENKTVKEVFDTLNEEQKTVVYAMIGQALEEAGANDDDDDVIMMILVAMCMSDDVYDVMTDAVCFLSMI